MSDRVKTCLKSLEFRDGVTCVDGGRDGVCHNHIVVAGLRHHAVDADRFELENRSLTEQLARVTSERDALSARLEAVTAALDGLIASCATIYPENGDPYRETNPDKFECAPFCENFGHQNLMEVYILAAGQTAPAPDPARKG